MSSKLPVASLFHAVRGPIEKAAFVRLMNLPQHVQRRLAGRPVVKDGQTLAVDTQLMLRLMRLQPDVWSMPPVRARAGLLAQAVMAGGRPPVGRVETVEAPAGTGRLYVPTDAPDVGPLLVFFHGGGFYMGGIESHDAACRVLAERSGVRVLALPYRLAPEDPFPAAYDDAIASFAWARERADAFGADPDRIGVGGDSAGGNLAAGVALAAREQCAFQLLIYPVTQMGADTESRRLFAEGFFLTANAIGLATGHYVPAGTDPDDPRLSPLCADVPDGVAPAYVVTAGFDPLRDEGEAYARKLEDAGVKVTLQRFPDQVHGFLNVLGAGHSAKAAVYRIAELLTGSL